MGDWNAVTELAHTTTIGAKALVWSWLQKAEREGLLVDLGRAGLGGEVPMTRCRGHPGTSYLDRIYATKSVFPCLSVHPGKVGSVPGTDGQEHFSDHNFIHVAVAPWVSKEPQHPHPCASWSRKHVKMYRQLLTDFMAGQVQAHLLGDEELVEQCLALREKMIWAMERVNAKYPPKVAPSKAVGHDWQEYVQQLVRLARRNPRIFFPQGEVISHVANATATRAIATGDLAIIVAILTAMGSRCVRFIWTAAAEIPGFIAYG
jgi:hypothetical protein